jgi:hypothetical protein
MPMDFTSLFVGGFIIGLVIVAIGVSIWLGPLKSPWGIFIIVVGAIPMLFCLVSLIADPIFKLIDKWQNRVWTQVLSKDLEYQGIRLPRGTKVEWRGSSFITSAVLARPQTVLGIPFEGEMKFVYGMHVATDLEMGTLAGDHSIDGVPCKAHKPVEFFPADGPGRDDSPEKVGIERVGIGKLMECTASAAFDFDGNRYQADAEVTLDSSGHVLIGVLAVDQGVDGHWCKQGTVVACLEKRAISFTLARDETVYGIACKAGKEVVVEMDMDRVKSAVLAHDQQIDGIPCRGGDAVGFERGTGSYPLDTCVIRRLVTMSGEDWPAGTKLKGLSATDWVEFTLPRGASIVVDDIKFAGRYQIKFDRTPPRLREAKVLDGEPGYVELLGAHYSDIYINQNKGQGTLSEPATIHGEACKPGDTIEFKFGTPK